MMGTTSAYAGAYESDGYQIIATLVWKDLSTYATTLNTTTPETITATNPAVIGTCVETLNIDGTAIESGNTTAGNYAVCHWMYFIGQSGTHLTSIILGGVANADWGETRYYNEAEWGHGGSTIRGANIQTLGTAISTTSNGFAIGGGGGTTLTVYNPGSYYTMSWYQPLFQNAYAKTALRRYNGGASDYDKVKPYCVSAREITSFSIFGIAEADDTGHAGIVSLSGASTLVAAIALGTSVLAF